jgi:hypothetical protein
LFHIGAKAVDGWFFVTLFLWGCYLASFGLVTHDPFYAWLESAYSFIASITAATTLYLFLILFTGEPDKQRLPWMIRFCYLFTMLALVMSIWPFVAPHKLAEGRPGARIISMTEGCSLAPTDGNKEQVLPVVQCQKEPNAGSLNCQWILNIGGFMTPMPGVPVQDTTLSEEAASACVENDTGCQNFALNFALNKECMAEREACREVAQGITEQPAREQKLRQCQDQFEQCNPPPGLQPTMESSWTQIESGIVVPLYVLIFALIGGAVSMTRRVPEIQHNAWWVEQEVTAIINKHPLASKLVDATNHYTAMLNAAGRLEPDSLQQEAEELANLASGLEIRHSKGIQKTAQLADRVAENSSAAGLQPLQEAAQRLSRILSQLQQTDTSKLQSDAKRLEDEHCLQVRNKLVFEIMQVLSAPMIAVIAVYSMKLETGATTALVAFAAGFASKTILYVIRAMLDALQPQYVTRNEQAQQEKTSQGLKKLQHDADSQQSERIATP